MGRKLNVKVGNMLGVEYFGNFQHWIVIEVYRGGCFTAENVDDDGDNAYFQPDGECESPDICIESLIP